MRIPIMILTAILCLPLTAQNQTPDSVLAKKTGTLGVVATSHLDTQWRWTIQSTINEFVPATLRDNFRLFDIYPSYTFSFEGAFRYMLAKEYYPEEYERLKKYIADGRWRVAGSWVDAVDVNMPSFESLVRHALYGNGFYQREFGKTSRDIFLPDCFGFGYALPSIAAHCGIKSFSTQKLSWGCSVPVPFDIGFWQGVDGSSVLAALRPGDYVAEIEGDLTRDSTWISRVKNQGDSTGLYAAYMYFGTGDIGGAPESLSVGWLEKSINGDGPLEVKSIGSDDLTRLVMSGLGIPENSPFPSYYPNPFSPSTAKTRLNQLPRYKGELLMTRHGVGCYTSQAAMKRWNRKNELLADATERACVIADLLGVSPYPREALRDTWTRFLWHQFHDDLTGTSIPEAYTFSWSDQILCQNRFSAMLEHSVEAVASQLDTRVKGMPLVIYNPLSTLRQEVVEATIPCKDTENGKERSFMTFRVYDIDGKEVPSSVVECDHLKNRMTINFIALTPSVGFAVYDVRPSEKPCQLETELEVTDSTLENREYFVKVNKLGEIAYIFDKSAKRQLLSAPIAFQFLHDKPDRWPAWEIQYTDIAAEPMKGIIKSTEISIEETGPVRVSLAITQKTDKSTIRTVVSLSAGDSGNRIEFDNEVEWHESETLLKVAFPVTTPNDSVAYDIGLGAITRGVNTEKKYEVPGHQWANIMATDGSYGVTVMNDCKYGWDYPDSSTLRLSLIHTPGVFESWNWVGDQKSQDMGRHEFKFAVMGHTWPLSAHRRSVPLMAANFNQPLLSFNTTPHKGPLGKSFSFAVVCRTENLTEIGIADIVNSEVIISALKMAENESDAVIRLKERTGRPINDIKIEFAWPVISAREINGIEEAKGQAVVAKGKIATSFKPYQPKAFAFKLNVTDIDRPLKAKYRFLDLAYNIDGISFDANRTDGDLDGAGNTIAGELLPNTLVWLDVPYVFGPKEDGQPNALSCTGQTIDIPHGSFNRVCLLTTSTGGPSVGIFDIGGISHEAPIPDYCMPLAQWNSRLSGDEFVETADRITPAYINTAPVAWYGSHRHTSKGENEAYIFTYLFLLEFDIPRGGDQIILPNNPQIKIFAVTAVKSDIENTLAAQPLYDRTNATLSHIHSDHHNFLDSTMVSISCPIPGAEVRYTTDGSEPTEESSRYAKPFYMTDAGTIKSRAFLEGADDSYIAQASFNKLTPHAAASITSITPGLDGRYFEGEWSKLPNFDTIKVLREYEAETVDLPEFSREEDFGLTLRGYIKIPVDGLYQFFISSDDGSKLYVSDTLVVDNDGLHGSGDVSGEIALMAGYQALAIDMFQCKGGRDLMLSWQGPGFEKQVVAADALFSGGSRSD